MLNKTVVLAGFLAAAIPGLAQAHSYNYLEGGYAEHEDEGGLRLAAALGIHPKVAAFGEIVDTGDVEELTAGAMLHQPLDARIDWLLGVSLESVDVGRHDDTGIGFRAGLRWQLPHPLVEISPQIRHREVFDDGQTSLRVAGLLAMSTALKLHIAVQGGDDDHLEAGIRYDF